MLTTLLTAASSGLGSYQLAKWFAIRAIKRKRSAQQATHAYRTVKAGALYAKKLYEALADGVDPDEAAKARAIYQEVKAAIAKAEQPSA